MEVDSLEIPDVKLIKPEVFGDERGHFCECFHEEKFKTFDLPSKFVQDNISVSTQGVLRGLHYQKDPHAQGKLVSVTNGVILDIAVDIRKDSPTKGKYVSQELSSEHHHMIYIPEGFAHGFLVKSDTATVHYKCTVLYHPDSEETILWNDKILNIDWQIPATITPIISEKDQQGIKFT